mmetsp:Transcript_20072/g.41124  ORF Transcript_20072/g.41124 Transcript_20072/m.41124 type:complete len:242 (-) Transcript_20072:540-1265(-)
MAGFTSLRQVGPLITTLVGTHIAFTLASIARAGIGGLQNHEDGTAKKQEIEECFDAKHYDLMTAFVARFYRGRGTKPARNNDTENHRGGSADGTNTITGVKLAPTATFEDPAAVCVGEEEVREAFRALRLLDPVSLSPPRCVDVRPLGDSIQLTFLLHQQYTIPLRLFLPGPPPQISLRSLLTVTVRLQQMQERGLPESEFIVTEMKELWYGNPLLWPYHLFYVPRRLNGIVSYHLTSRIL